MIHFIHYRFCKQNLKIFILVEMLHFKILISLMFFMLISNTMQQQYDLYDDYNYNTEAAIAGYSTRYSMLKTKRGILNNLTALNLMKRNYINRFITYIKKKLEVPKDKVYNDKIWMNRFG